MRPYLQHARRHLPTGSDPLPFTATVTHYLAGFQIVSSLASSTASTDVDLDPATASWGTEAGAETASDHLDLRSNGAGHGIAFLQNGLYVVDMWASLNLSGAPASGACASLSYTGTGQDIGGNGDAAPWVASLLGTQYRARPDKRIMVNMPADYGPPPFYVFPLIGQNSGSTVSTIVVSFLAKWINDDGNTGF